MRWKIVLVVFIVLVLGLGGYIFYRSYLTLPDSQGAVGPPVNITYENIEDLLSRSSLVGDLPEEGILLLRFYNFDSGVREWEKSYILRKNNVKEGFLENADIIFLLDSRYLDYLTTHNFCSVITAAKENGDLGTETTLSTTKLLWKYKSMTKYKDCLGF